MAQLRPDTNACAPQAAPGYFAAPLCRNCGAALATPFCAQCGQKRIGRLGLPDLGAEIWKKLRVFEISMLKAALFVLFRPGTMARRYVLGQRKTHLHPLTLLFSAVLALLVLLEATHYFAVADETLNQALALVVAYSKWSFSLGLFALLATGLIVFGRGFGFNPIEHLVLAAYAQSAMLLLNALALLPLLAWPGAESVALHKAVAGPFMTILECAIAALAFCQAFALDPRRHWLRLGLAVALFLALKLIFIRLYAAAVIRIVISQLT